ncbi:hypothetical protein NDU88_004451 [Pleurodeles waltl]|uniref:Uncharacterized protein n=1 Tax=Pleurodeles waltl TaxID=8319 RepID=A0AAV7NSI9_PLEWA|nr:hypothetical protein NDU88_004451 [Pleurodeles waltl]
MRMTSRSQAEKPRCEFTCGSLMPRHSAVSIMSQLAHPMAHGCAPYPKYHLRSGWESCRDRPTIQQVMPGSPINPEWSGCTRRGITPARSLRNSVCIRAIPNSIPDADLKYVTDLFDVILERTCNDPNGQSSKS